MNKKEILLFLAIVGLLLIEFFLFRDLPFFWDGISKVTRATWIYDHNFSSFILPTEYSSGHPPLWITSLAIFWEVLGRTLTSSRFLLLLVNIGVFYQILLLCKRNFTTSVPIFFFLLICIEPTLIAQTTSLNNDMMLLFFTLFSINSLIKNKWLFYALALSGLLFTNLRGVYCFIALISIHIIYTKRNLLLFNRKMVVSYSIAVIGFGTFLFLRYTELGWWILTNNEHYVAHRETATYIRILKNVFVFIKNILELGRVVVWIPLVLLLLKFPRSEQYKMSQSSRQVLIALLVFTIVFFFGFVPFSNPMGPRYMLICFILANILFVNVLFESTIKKRTRNIFLSLTVIAFISGHFWIYPATISQAWDSSLAYVGYYNKEEKMLKFLEEKNIPHSEVGTNIPLNARKTARLEERGKGFKKFPTLDLTTNKYVIFSNIENKTSDETIIELRNNWREVKTYKKLGLFITLYQNPNTMFVRGN